MPVFMTPSSKPASGHGMCRSRGPPPLHDIPHSAGLASFVVADPGPVIVSLHVESAPPGFQYPLRRIALSTGDRLRIGRASKVESKGFVAAENNGWFDTPVMSRQHAEITIDSEVSPETPGPVSPALADACYQKVINITDTGSLHGTFVNGAIVRKDTCHELVHGDEVNFGVEIYRATESYPPAKIRVGIQHLDE